MPYADFSRAADREDAELERIGERDLAQWPPASASTSWRDRPRRRRARPRLALGLANLALVLTTLIGGVIDAQGDMLSAEVYERWSRTTGWPRSTKPVLRPP